jgi:hypothetical protein
VEGKWFWQQIPWHGYFVLVKSADSYTGTLDDVFEGTCGDRELKVSGTFLVIECDGWAQLLVESGFELSMVSP